MHEDDLWDSGLCFGIVIGIAVGIVIAFDSGTDSDPDSDTDPDQFGLTPSFWNSPPRALGRTRWRMKRYSFEWI